MARDESLRRGREFVNRLLVVSGLVVLGVIVWANWGPGAPVAMPTVTPTPVAGATATATEMLVAIKTSTPTLEATNTPSFYGQEVIQLVGIAEPCCVSYAEQAEDITTGRVGFAVFFPRIRPFAKKQVEVQGIKNRVWLAKTAEEEVVSFGRVRLCGLAKFGEQGTFVFCPQGETDEPFKAEMLSGKDSVGLDPNNLLEPRWWTRLYNGLLVPFNASDLQPQ